MSRDLCVGKEDQTRRYCLRSFLNVLYLHNCTFIFDHSSPAPVYHVRRPNCSGLAPMISHTEASKGGNV